MPRTKLFDEQEVLEKAMESFWKRGFHATSMQNLVDDLGINRASLYDTFGSKKALFTRAFQHYRALNKQRIIDFLDQHDSVKEGFKQLFLWSIKDSLEDVDKKGCMVVNSTTELSTKEAFLQETIQQHKEEFEALFFDYLKKGVARGEIAPDKDLKSIAAFLYTFNNGLRVILKVSSDREQLEQTVETALAVLE